MIDWLQRLFRRHPELPPPDVAMTSDDEKRRMDETDREITARLERLRLVAEQSALRQIKDTGQ